MLQLSAVVTNMDSGATLPVLEPLFCLTSCVALDKLHKLSGS